VSDQNDSSLPSANPLTGIRILLVEDEPDTRLAMTYTLEKAGADVTAVGSAADAIAAVSASKNDRRYDVLLCDIGMPGEDGYSLLAKLRLLENLEGIAPLPAIAVTSYVQEADRARAEAVGFDATLDKPVQLRTMLTTIAELAKRSRRDRVS
jgi:CheY-like chemotaxis protein